MCKRSGKSAGKKNNPMSKKLSGGQKTEKRRVNVRFPEAEKLSEEKPLSKKPLKVEPLRSIHPKHQQASSALHQRSKKLVRPKKEVPVVFSTQKSNSVSDENESKEIVFEPVDKQKFRLHGKEKEQSGYGEELHGHVEKILSFIRRLIRTEIPKNRESFEEVKGLLPKYATRHAFDANYKKCRFVDVICIDQSRILVNSANNFIHGNRVPISEDGKNEMILTQLPLKNTVMDFWHMIWDENVQSVLVILTDGEWSAFGRRLKLVPKQDGCLHKPDGMCIVFQQQVVVSAFYSVICYGLSWKGVHRSIQWIQYSGWEHGRSPSETNSIWQIHSYLRRSKKPIVCMSMSGVGRAGSYAVLEMAHERIHNRHNKRLNLLDCVQKVRDARMHAVQNRVQLGFIQIALVDHLLASEKVRIDLENKYLERYQKLKQIQMQLEDIESVAHSHCSRTSSVFQ